MQPTSALPAVLLVDLDDTILHSSAGVRSLWTDACALAAGPRSPVGPEALLAAVHDYGAWFWDDPVRHRRGRLDLRAARREIVGGALARLGVEAPDLAHSVADRYHDLRDGDLRPLPGAVEALRALRAAGHRMALLTNGASAMQRDKIERFDLAGHFDAIRIEEEAGIGKPEPGAYLAALELLGAAPGDAAMIGDNYEWEVVAPARLGLRTVWVDLDGVGVPEGAAVVPDRVVRGLAELV